MLTKKKSGKKWFGRVSLNFKLAEINASIDDKGNGIDKI